MRKEAKGYLEIFIKGLQDILNSDSESKIEKIQKLIDSWVEKNDLHPENVKTVSKEELEEILGKKIKIVEGGIEMSRNKAKKKEGTSRKEVEEDEREIKTKIQEFLREHPDRMYNYKEIAKNLGIDQIAALHALKTEEEKIEMLCDKKGRFVFGIKQS